MELVAQQLLELLKADVLLHDQLALLDEEAHAMQMEDPMTPHGAAGAWAWPRGLRRRPA